MDDSDLSLRQEVGNIRILYSFYKFVVCTINEPISNIIYEISSFNSPGLAQGMSDHGQVFS